MATHEWARRLEGTQVTVNALHPGFVATEIFAKSGGISRLIAPLIKRLAASPEEGAETSVYLASSPEVAGVSGEYFIKKQAVSPPPVAYDAEVSQRLWTISAELTGLADAQVTG
jgi:NAD(P)-dependent dehydrogenase (short-subunit alcohol dehydrogenase family)